MTLNLRNSVRTSFNPGLRQSISGGVDSLDLFSSSSLDLKFAINKILADRVSGNNLVTFSRASSGTYVGSDGLIKTAVADAPRFDHDPVTGESLGLLIEEARTNLTYPSIPVDNSSAITVTLNAAVAPDNTTTATFCEPDNVNSGVRSHGLIAKTAGETYANTFYYKPSGYNVVGLDYQNGNPNSYAEGWIDVTTNLSYLKLPTSNASGFSDIQSIPVANGWYKITVIQEIVVGGNGYASGKLLSCRPDVPTAKNQAYTRVPGAGGYFWGNQEELGSFPSSLIHTTSSTATRLPDLTTIEGTNFTGGWYNQSEGTIFSDISPLAANSGRGYLFSDGSNGQRLGQNADSTTVSALFMFNNGIITPLAAAVSGMPKPIKACLAYKSGSSRGAIDGALKTLSTTSNVPDAIDQVGIGFQNYAGSSGFLNGHIKRLAYFSTRKTDQELTALTT